MKLNIDPRFFQAAATVIPTTLIAFSLTSKFLEFKAPGSEVATEAKVTFWSKWKKIRKSEDDNKHKPAQALILLGGDDGIVAVAILVFGTVIAEVCTLIALAFNQYPAWIFIADVAFIALLAWFVGYKALEPVLLKAKRQKLGSAVVIASLIVMTLSGIAVAGVMYWFELNPPTT